MDYELFLETILKSELKDWVFRDTLNRYIYIKNIAISITTNPSLENTNFDEDWLKSYSNKSATVQRFELCYNGTEIESFLTASVDGNRMYIPYPERPELTITKKQHKIGEIVNTALIGYEFDEYLNRAGIRVE